MDTDGPGRQCEPMEEKKNWGMQSGFKMAETEGQTKGDREGPGKEKGGRQR